MIVAFRPNGTQEAAPLGTTLNEMVSALRMGHLADQPGSPINTLTITNHAGEHTKYVVAHYGIVGKELFWAAFGLLRKLCYLDDDPNARESVERTLGKLNRHSHGTGPGAVAVTLLWTREFFDLNRQAIIMAALAGYMLTANDIRYLGGAEAVITAAISELNRIESPTGDHLSFTESLKETNQKRLVSA